MYLLEMNFDDIKDIKNGRTMGVIDYVNMLHEKILTLNALNKLVTENEDSSLLNSKEKKLLNYLIGDCIEVIGLDTKLYKHVINEKNDLPNSSEEFQKMLFSKDYEKLYCNNEHIEPNVIKIITEYNL